jgi:DNA (cytosine-5)-methyltransferase 1
MGPQRRNVDGIGRFCNLDNKSILLRASEILEALYGSIRTAETNRGLNPKRIVEAKRILRRLGLDTHCVVGCAENEAKLKPNPNPLVSSSFLSNLATHARKCCTTVHPRCNACPLLSFCSNGMRRNVLPSVKPIAIDLCAGAGALSAAFKREGFHVALAVENNKHAAQSYRVNNPGVPVLEVDVRRIRPSRILRTLGLERGQIAAVISGPPCQGFSAAGPRKPRAGRNFLFRAIARIAKGLNARILIMENVPGLKRVNGVSFQNKITAHFRKCGYVGEPVEVDASEFGVPQRRKRLIFACTQRNRHTASLRLRPLKGITRLTVTEALKGLPQPQIGHARNGCHPRHPVVHNHRAMAHSARVIRKIERIKPGEGPISYRRLPVGLAGTLIAGHRAMPVHPRQHRTITVREAARLQTMPDSFRFLGPHSEQPLQVANVVPYRLSRAIARSLLSSIRSNPLSKDR